MILFLSVISSCETDPDRLQINPPDQSNKSRVNERGDPTLTRDRRNPIFPQPPEAPEPVEPPDGAGEPDGGGAGPRFPRILENSKNIKDLIDKPLGINPADRVGPNPEGPIIPDFSGGGQGQSGAPYNETVQDRGILQNEVYYESFDQGEPYRIAPGVGMIFDDNGVSGRAAVLIDNGGQPTPNKIYGQTIQAPFTLEFFAQPNRKKYPYPAQMKLLSFEIGNQTYHLIVQENKSLVLINQDSQEILATPVSTIKHDPFYWDQIALVVQNNSLALFTNGQRVDFANGNFNQLAQHFSFARAENGVDRYDGLVDEIRLYNQALDNFCKTCGVDAQGFVVLQHDGLQFTHPQRQPGMEPVKNSLNFEAARNEYEPLVFSMYSEKAYEDITIEVSALAHGGEEIGQEKIDVRVVPAWKQFTQTRIPESYIAQYGLVPNRMHLINELLLYDENDIENLRGQTRLIRNRGGNYQIQYALMNHEFNSSLKPFGRTQYVITIQVDQNKTPGIYRGTVLIKQRGEILKRVPLNLNVLNLTLPDSRDIPQIFGIYYRGALNPYPNFLKGYVSQGRLESEMRDLRAHNINLYYSEQHSQDASMETYDPNNVRDEYNIAFAKARQYGFKYLMMKRCFSSEAGRVSDWGPYNKAKTMFDEVYCYGHDEPGNPVAINSQALFAAALHRKMSLDEYNGYSRRDINAIRELFERHINNKPKVAVAITKEYAMRLSDPGSALFTAGLQGRLCQFNEDRDGDGSNDIGYDDAGDFPNGCVPINEVNIINNGVNENAQIDINGIDPRICVFDYSFENPVVNQNTQCRDLLRQYGLPDVNCTIDKARKMIFYQKESIYNCAPNLGTRAKWRSTTLEGLGIEDETTDLEIISLGWTNPISQFVWQKAHKEVLVDVTQQILNGQLRTRPGESPYKQVYYYGNSSEGESPVRIAPGVFAWLARSDGMMPYAYWESSLGMITQIDNQGLVIGWHHQIPDGEHAYDTVEEMRREQDSFDDPFNDFDCVFLDVAGPARCKDYYLAYPADIMRNNRRVPASIPTVNWEKTREGFDDYRYFLALCKIVKPNISYEQCPYDLDVIDAFEPVLGKYRQDFLEATGVFKAGHGGIRNLWGSIGSRHEHEIQKARRELVRRILNR